MLLDYPTIGRAEYATCRAKIAAAISTHCARVTEDGKEIRIEVLAMVGARFLTNSPMLNVEDLTGCRLSQTIHLEQRHRRERFY